MLGIMRNFEAREPRALPVWDRIRSDSRFETLGHLSPYRSSR